ncbi:MAG: hypothetical protein JWN23_2046 [Rhodocyclales bacterium]|nr:hypothetical protein [Rhodocyclales bacterium]
MGRQSLQSLQASKSLAQLLALNALFDAARAGEAGRESAAAVQSAMQIAATLDAVDPACDTLLSNCYAALMDATERPSRLS